MAVSMWAELVQESIDINSNSSKININVYYSWTYGSFNHNGAKLTISLDGKSFSITKNLNPDKTTQGQALLYKYITQVFHDNDGNKTVNYSVSLATGISSGTLYEDYTAKLEPIPRVAYILTAPNFTDEQNPEITYTNPAGASAKLEACISLTGSKDDIPYRTISSTKAIYKFELTEAERDILRNATTSKTRKVKFFIRTTIGGSVQYASLEKTLTIVNANPVISPSVEDTNTSMIALTGNKKKFVRYYSNPRYAINATGQKGATIKSYSVVCGSQARATATGTFNSVESNTVEITVKDSRGFITSQTLTLDMIDYVRLTANIGKNNPDADGNYAFNVSGNYFSGSFGAVSNTLTTEYRYKENGGNYSNWIAVIPTITDNYYSYSVDFTNLNYQSTYTFQTRAIDAIAVIESPEKVIKSAPVFDWGEDDFNINGTLSINGNPVMEEDVDTFTVSSNGMNLVLRPNGVNDSSGEAILDTDGNLTLSGNLVFSGSGNTNKVLWEGALLMGADDTIALAEPITQQANGVVLVFSGYSGSTSAQYNFTSFYIPKGVVAVNEGVGHSFIMSGMLFSPMAIKYLYIGDATITGHGNNATGEIAGATGITYSNNKFCLRYVYGV